MATCHKRGRGEYFLVKFVSHWNVAFGACIVIASPTPDALHVCAAYPWAAYALVFADSSAYFTANGPQLTGPGCTPGKSQHAVAFRNSR